MSAVIQRFAVRPARRVHDIPTPVLLAGMVAGTVAHIALLIWWIA